ncbi:MAG: 2OG-Fe(II) oxygenase [Chloroflexi bacterium]|nr:2OG-Fe(II) oxygenase [Chloroflexota bacterium]
MAVNGSELEKVGYQVVDGFLTDEQCRLLLEKISDFRDHHTLPEIHRPMKGRSLRYHVIQGEQIREHLPSIWDLYNGEVNQLVDRSLGFPLGPLGNTRAGVNVNLMRPNQSSYRWHYDRACVTSIIYLNEVEGGETEFYPNYRILLRKGKNSSIQRALDRFIQIKPILSSFGSMVRVSPKVGRLVMMRADRCWHSVRSVRGERERINIILSYDFPGTEFPSEEGLDSYLYTQEEQRSADPNYS